MTGSARRYTECRVHAVQQEILRSTRHCRVNRHAQSGAFAIMFVPLLFVLAGFFGLALDLSLVYNRKAELQGVAQGIALDAARELNGTSAGVVAALTKAAVASGRQQFGYGRTIPWNENAIRFSNSPAADADWVDAATARSMPTNQYYVKVDTEALDDDTSLVDMIFIRILSDAFTSVRVSERAVAGRSTINITPLAVCAMSPDPAIARTSPLSTSIIELVEFGFRRGVSYDLMNLNPGGASPASFAVDPLAPPGGAGSSSNTSASALAPFVCTGNMWTARVTGGAIRVSSPFPVESLYRELNSRFDRYTDSRCNANGAPPDFNIKSYSHGASGGASWMSPRPSNASALSVVTGTRLETIADLPTPPASTPPGAYGVLWAHSRAVKFSAYSPGSLEPDEGYATFTTSDWPNLYPATPAPAPSSYPASPPYFAASGTHYGRPSTTNLPISVLGRRILYVPLLRCPVPAGANVGATALAIGKFFMTVPATETSIHAEFAGTAPESKLTSHIVLYQ